MVGVADCDGQRVGGIGGHRPGSRQQRPHHGSDLVDFIRSLRRIRSSDAEWLLPSHGPIFRKDNDLLDRTIQRLESYLHMADFGTCAVDWPLMDEWEREIVEGRLPTA